MLRKITFIFIFIIISASVAAAAFKHGEKFPNVALTGKLTTEQLNYLGLKSDGPWKIKDIKADFVLIEIYSMYCPHCQKEAPAVNELYSQMQNSEKYAPVKLIGIGAGNSEFEINFFKEKYAVKFPLFSDSDLTVHAETGSTGTPHFYLIKITKSGLETILSHEGPFENPQSFLKKISKAAKLK